MYREKKTILVPLAIFAFGIYISYLLLLVHPRRHPPKKIGSNMVII